MLDFFIEDTSADPIKTFVEVADDLGSNQTIWVYYGKSGATTNSNGTNTFLSFFDGDSTGWTEVDPNSHISFANNRLEWSGLHRGEDAYVYQSASVNGDLVIEYTEKVTALQDRGIVMFGVMSDMLDDWNDVNNAAKSFHSYDPGDPSVYGAGGKRVSDSETLGSPTIVVSVNTQYWIRTIVDRSGNLSTYVYSDSARTTQVGSTSVVSLSDLSATLQYSMLLTAQNTGGTYAARYSSGWLDDFWIRKYNLPEPAFTSAGAEQSAPVGHPVMRRWGGIPGMQYTGRGSW